MKKLLFLFVALLLEAKEPTLMFLNTIYSNDTLLFRHRQHQHLCKPYGALSIDAIYYKKKINSTCKKAFEQFIVANPKLQNYAHYQLHEEQLYRVELYPQNQCLLFSKGKKTYSQQLIFEGLAIVDPKLKDLEYSFVFQRAYRYAKTNKKGMWQSPLIRTCIAEMFGK